VAEYLVELPPKEMLVAKLHEAIRFGERAGGEGHKEMMSGMAEVQSSQTWCSSNQHN